MLSLSASSYLLLVAIIIPLLQSTSAFSLYYTSTITRCTPNLTPNRAATPNQEADSSFELDHDQQQQYEPADYYSAEDDDNDNDDPHLLQQLDKTIEMALENALSKVNHLMYNNNNESPAIPPRLKTFFQECINNCRMGPSTIPNAGNGLFATRDISKGTIISLYPMHCLGLDYDCSEETENQLLVCGSPEDAEYFEQQQQDPNDYLLHVLGNRPLPLLPSYVDPTDGSLFIDVNPQHQNHRHDDDDDDDDDAISTSSNNRGSWLSHYINDGATVMEEEQTQHYSDDDDDDEKQGLSTSFSLEKYYEQSALRRNCLHVPLGPSPLMATVASKDIKQGQEFFTTYGGMYWLEQHFQRFVATNVKEMEDEEDESEDDDDWYDELMEDMMQHTTPATQQQAEASMEELYDAIQGIQVQYRDISRALEEVFERYDDDSEQKLRP